MFWQILGFSAAALTMFGFVPQIIKIYKTKSVKDISLVALIEFSLGIFLWVLYGIHLKNIVIIIANTVSLATLIIAFVLYFKYK
jgi:MtN3 and saliva related transmembrane protein